MKKRGKIRMWFRKKILKWIDDTMYLYLHEHIKTIYYEGRNDGINAYKSMLREEIQNYYGIKK